MPLHSPAGIIPCPDVDLTGQGSMLSARIDVPEDAERLTVWFSYAAASGDTRYDSDYGANYRFGFPCREIEVVRATVTRRPDEPPDLFELTVSTTDAVEDVAALFFLVADPACAKHEARLQRSAARTPASGLPSSGAPPSTFRTARSSASRYATGSAGGASRTTTRALGTSPPRPSPTASRRLPRRCSKRRQRGAEPEGAHYRR